MYVTISACLDLPCLLTLKAPANKLNQTMSYVAFLLTFLVAVSIETNSVDPDQSAPETDDFCWDRRFSQKLNKCTCSIVVCVSVSLKSRSV